MSNIKDAVGPYVIWENYGYEGWHPTSYPTLKDVLLAPRNYECAITKIVEFDAVEKDEL